MVNSSDGVIGIDLGTTFSAVAHLNQDGNAVALTDELGSTTIPSIAFFQDDRILVGNKAAQAAVRQPTRAVYQIKRLMGTQVVAARYRSAELNPEAVSAIILTKLKQIAESHLGDVAGAVISVPYYFDDTRRKATVDAGRIAGLKILDIVNEPVAATLYYAYGQKQLNLPGETDGESPEALRPVLVYDLGGGTFDVAVVRYNTTQFEVVATRGDVRLGGIDWTNQLAAFASESFSADHPEWEDDELFQRTLFFHCEELKKILSSKLRGRLHMPWAGSHLDLVVTRDAFEELCAHLVLRTQNTLMDVLEESKVPWDELADIVLVGGSARMPMIRRMMEQVSGWLAYSELPPGESVALGAAIHAAMIASCETQSGSLGWSQVRQQNIASHSLRISLQERKSRKQHTRTMIPRGTRLPHSITRQFHTLVDNQRGALIKVLEGESEDPSGCVEIGRCLLDELAAGLPAGSPIEVTYQYDSSGRASVTARDPEGGSRVSKEIFRSTGLSDKEIDRWRQLLSTFDVV